MSINPRISSIKCLVLLLVVTLSNVVMADEWASNGSYAMKINGYTEASSIKSLQLMRTDSKSLKALDAIEKKLAAGDHKLIILDAALRNDTDKTQKLGYAAWVRNDFTRTIYLRGDEGTEVVPLENTNPYYYGERQGGEIENGLTYYTKGGMAKDSAVSPGTVVSGKIVYVVPKWFNPALAFTKIKAAIAGDNPELFGKSRLTQNVSRVTDAKAKPAEAQAKGKFCTSCGAKAADGNAFCGNCGHKF